MYRVKDVMTDEVLSCRPEDSLAHAVALMRDRGCGCVPVTDAEGRVIGLLTDRDAVMATLRAGEALADVPVDGAFSAPVVCCDPSDSLERAETLMRVNHVRRLPVIDSDRRLAGILSLTDLARNIEFSPVVGCSGLSPRQVAVVLAETSGLRKLSPPDDSRVRDDGSPRPIVGSSFTARKQESR